MKKSRIVIFDDSCNLCNFWLNFIKKRDKNNLFLFIGSRSEESKTITKKYKIEGLEINSIILVKNENIYTKSTAIFEILNDLGSYFYLFNIFKVFPLCIRDSLYTLLSKNRHKLFAKKNTSLMK